MADIGFIRGQLAGLSNARDRDILTKVFDHVLGNYRLGVPEHQVRAVNGQQYWEESTTATSTGEFSFAHGLSAIPSYGIPVLDLSKVGSKAGFLAVTRAADSKRVYLRADAGSTNAPITLLVEG